MQLIIDAALRLVTVSSNNKYNAPGGYPQGLTSTKAFCACHTLSFSFLISCQLSNKGIKYAKTYFKRRSALNQIALYVQLGACVFVCEDMMTTNPYQTVLLLSK